MAAWDSVASHVKVTLSKDAEARLQKDLKNLHLHPIMGASASPLQGNLAIWHATVNRATDNPDDEFAIHIILEFPENYPQKPPKAFFCSPFSYKGGAKMQDSDGRFVVCLDIFGNFGAIHHEWGKDGAASGWTSAYSVSSILVNMQAMLAGNDFVDNTPSSVQAMRVGAKSLKCSCGHVGANPSTYYPPLPSNSVPTSQSEQSKTSSTSGSIRNYKSEITCYVRQNSMEDNEQFGYGIAVAKGNVSSTCEYLSLRAFESGTRTSTMNKQFGYWLPLFITHEHWNSIVNPKAGGGGSIDGPVGKGKHLTLHDLFVQNIRIIYAGMAMGKKVTDDIQIFEVLSSLMNNMVVDVMNSKNNLTANDKFITGYFSFYRILTEMKKTYPKLVDYANTKITEFLSSDAKRTKQVVPNLGTWLILLTITDKYGWNDVASAFVQECDARNVKWYVEGGYNTPATCPELKNPECLDRCVKVFQNTVISRNLVCFQKMFIKFVLSVNIEEFDANYGFVSDQIKGELKEAYTTIVNMKNWNQYFDWLEMPQVSDSDRNDQLIKALNTSAVNKYHSEIAKPKGGYGRRY